MEGVGGKGGGEGRVWGGGERAEVVLVLAQVFGESQGHRLQHGDMTHATHAPKRPCCTCCTLPLVM